MESQPFSYASIIAASQLTALNSPTPPTPGSQQYQINASYITLAIMDWENTRNVLWNELWVDQPNYFTLAVGTTTIDLPSDFKFMGGGYVRITYAGAVNPSILPFPVKRLPEIELNPYNNQREFYVTGNISTGFQLVLGWSIQTGDAEVGATISFRYYKYANVPQLNSSGILTNPNNVPEMSDPSYVYKYVTSKVAAANYNLNLYQIYSGEAATSLNNMIQGNEMGTNYQDDYVKDVDRLLGASYQIQDRLDSAWWSGSRYGG
jgi:hypothetical protein